jgi:hypothetical protein
MSTVTPRPVIVQSKWFRSAFDRALHEMHVEPTEENLVNMVRRTVNIALDDGEISEEQLRYEVGLLIGTLFASGE